MQDRKPLNRLHVVVEFGFGARALSGSVVAFSEENRWWRQQVPRNGKQPIARDKQTRALTNPSTEPAATSPRHNSGRSDALMLQDPSVAMEPVHSKDDKTPLDSS